MPAYQLVAGYLLPDAPEDWMEQASAPKRKKAAPAPVEAVVEEAEVAPVEETPAVVEEQTTSTQDSDASARIEALSASVSSLTALVRQLLGTRGASSPGTSIAGTNTLPSGDILVFRGDGEVFVVSHEDGNVYKAKNLTLPTDEIPPAWPTRDVAW